jgi:Fe-S-cluster containining protein
MSKDIDPACRQCQSKCCRYFCFQIDEPDSFESFENLRWFLLHEGITIHIDEGNWFISVNNKCNYLGDDGQCLSYDTRPLICRKYTTDGCDATGDDYEYDELFESPEQVAAYARQTLGHKKYDKAWAKLCAASSAEPSAKEDCHAESKKKDAGKVKNKGKDKSKGKGKGKDKSKGR